MTIPPDTEDWVLAADAVVTPTETLRPGWVRLAGASIAGLGAGAPPTPTVRRLPAGCTVVPGLVDMHVHGAGGGNMTAPDPDELTQAFRALLQAGVTATVVSLVTAPTEELERSLGLVAGLVNDRDPNAPRVIGSHLEGPFLAHDHRGSHDLPFLRSPDRSLLDRLVRAGDGTVRMCTLAPELDGADALVTLLRNEGVVVAMGHTGATYDQTRRAVDRGVRVGTHLFNGMRRPHHREPGPALTLLDDERVTVELINDAVHVHPVVARVVTRAAFDGRLALISDGVAATGAADGYYKLGRVDIRHRHGRVETADGRSLGGGANTLDGSLRRAVTDLGLDLPHAVRAATCVPAAALGVGHLAGCLAAGRDADLAVLDTELEVVGVMRAGQWVRNPIPGPTAGLEARRTESR